MRIAIAGNIGAGKTSLTKQLSKSLKYKSYYEDVIANPYLESVRSQQGLHAFRVVMDASNNTPDLIDQNILYGQIFFALFKMRGRLLQEGVIKAKPY